MVSPPDGFFHLSANPPYVPVQFSQTIIWQFVAGGGEDDETPLQAAQREMEEEVGIVGGGNLMPLDSMATVPKNCFAAAKSWPQSLYVVPEHCFAVNAEGHNFILSHEHTALQWIPYIEAWQKLKWDSNRNALWELNERLKEEGFAPDQVPHCR